MADKHTSDTGKDDHGKAKAPTQAELARKAMELKRKAAAGHDHDAVAEDGTPLHPGEAEAAKARKVKGDAHHYGPASGALDHAGHHPARERSGHRGS